MHAIKSNQSLQIRYAMAPIEGKKRSVWRINPQIVELILDYVLSQGITNNVAFGTYRINDPNGTKTYVARTIREVHNAELVRQLKSIIVENGFTPPSSSTLFKILALLPATGNVPIAALLAVSSSSYRAPHLKELLIIKRSS